jgi:hypothetical protein
MLIGIASFSFDFNVPYSIFGVKRRYLLRINLKNALLFPELYRVIDYDVVISKELGSNSNFRVVLSISISTGTLLAITDISN